MLVGLCVGGIVLILIIIIFLSFASKKATLKKLGLENSINHFGGFKLISPGADTSLNFGVLSHTGNGFAVLAYNDNKFYVYLYHSSYKVAMKTLSVFEKSRIAKASYTDKGSFRDMTFSLDSGDTFMIQMRVGWAKEFDSVIKYSDK